MFVNSLRVLWCMCKRLKWKIKINWSRYCPQKVGLLELWTRPFLLLKLFEALFFQKLSVFWSLDFRDLLVLTFVTSSQNYCISLLKIWIQCYSSYTKKAKLKFLYNNSTATTVMVLEKYGVPFRVQNFPALIFAVFLSAVSAFVFVQTSFQREREIERERERMKERERERVSSTVLDNAWLENISEIYQQPVK